MYVICVDNVGFEDQLTTESVYLVEKIGVNGYSVYDDKEIERWFGGVHFAIVNEGSNE